MLKTRASLLIVFFLGFIALALGGILVEKIYRMKHPIVYRIGRA